LLSFLTDFSLNFNLEKKRIQILRQKIKKKKKLPKISYKNFAGRFFQLW